MIINGIKLNDVKVDKSEKTELSERDNKIIGWVSLALATLFLIAFFLGGFFSPVKASAGELVGGDEPIESLYGDYFIRGSSNGTYSVYVNPRLFSGTDSFTGKVAIVPGTSNSMSFKSIDECINFLTTEGGSFFDESNCPISDILYSSCDLVGTTQSFMQAPCVIHKEATVGGLQAPEIATALTSQMVGLVPLVLGLLVLAIGLWKGLKHLRQTLSRA